MVSDQKQDAPRTVSQWLRIPDGTMVQHRLDGQKGHIDGLTEIVTGPEQESRRTDTVSNQCREGRPGADCGRGSFDRDGCRRVGQDGEGERRIPLIGQQATAWCIRRRPLRKDRLVRTSVSRPRTTQEPLFNTGVPGAPIAILPGRDHRPRMSWAALAFRPFAAHDEPLFPAV